MIERLFKLNNLKITKQRLLVVNSIIKLNEKATIKNIIKNTTKEMNKSTVYRVINVLLKNNIIEIDINDNNDNFYKVKEEHIHYIKCIKCNKIEKLKSCPISNSIDGFDIINHSIRLEGICKNCKDMTN